MDSVNTNVEDEIDEATAREFLMENVDNSVTLLAVNAPFMSAGVVCGVGTGN